jgi:hypothetical protein
VIVTLPVTAAKEKMMSLALLVLCVAVAVPLFPNAKVAEPSNTTGVGTKKETAITVTPVNPDPLKAKLIVPLNVPDATAYQHCMYPFEPLPLPLEVKVSPVAVGVLRVGVEVAAAYSHA